MEPVEKIAAAVLYEGYVLYPYRHSSVKNQRRWTFGGVYPPAYAEASAGNDPHTMQTQVLVVGDERTELDVKVRFLHVVKREIKKGDGDTFAAVDELRVGGQVYRPWEEAAERSAELESVALGELLDGGRSVALGVPGRTEEELLEASGETVGSLVRGWQSLRGRVEVGAEALEGDLFKVTVRILNTTPWEGGDREEVLKRAFVSTHAILRAEEGEFVSLLEPPAEYEAAAEACEYAGVWPVLVGEEGERSSMLASPIILYDYPQIAPESPGDLFDGTEIDEILTLRIMTLTDDEKREMREADPRAREILDRTESLTPDDFMKMHGAIRELRVLGGDDPFAAWEQETGIKPQSVTVDGVDIRKGSRVLLRPRPGGDVMDLALAGKVAIVEAVEQDYENRVHLAVTIEDDPGRDLGDECQPGHRFFFAAEEVEPL